MILLDASNITIGVGMEYFRDFKATPDVDTLRIMLAHRFTLLRREMLSYASPIDIIALDGSNYWRKDLFPHYKAKRKSDREKEEFDFEAFFAARKVIMEEFRQVSPWMVVEVNRAEADDIIATFALKNKERVCIVSTDKDFLQLQHYRDGLRQYSPIRRQFLNPKDYIPMHHILGGDSGDGIPNVWSDADTLVTEGKRQKTFTRKLKEMTANASEEEVVKMLTAEQQARYAMNKNLIDLRRIPPDVEAAILEAGREEALRAKGDWLQYLINHRCTSALEIV